jgi:hypothetical protein
MANIGRFRTRAWRVARPVCGGILLLVVAGGSDVLGQGQGVPVGQVEPRRDSGQGIAPVFEGWAPNPDGTFSLYFGYMNRNWTERLDVPLGPNNFFEPGPADRGQPTHFLPRRQKQVFAIVVPKDFGSQTLVWTLSVRGRTERVPGSIKPLLEIRAFEDNDGNPPPKVDVAPERSASIREPLVLSASVAGLAPVKPRRNRGDPQLAQSLRRTDPGAPNVTWSKYRGPGTVTFTDSVTPIADGMASTTAAFSEPGVYVLHVRAADRSAANGIPGFACCWTNRTVTVTVNPAATAQGGR